MNNDKSINLKFALGDIVNVNPDLEGVCKDDVSLNPYKIVTIQIDNLGISYRLHSMTANASTAYYEYALISEG